MVSLLRSNCHSVSLTFITRLCARTRSTTLRRASSSEWRTSLSVRSSSDVARRSTARRGASAAGSATGDVAQPEQPPHFLSATSPMAVMRPRSRPRSASTTTDSPTRSGSPLSGAVK